MEERCWVIYESVAYKCIVAHKIYTDGSLQTEGNAICAAVAIVDLQQVWIFFLSRQELCHIGLKGCYCKIYRHLKKLNVWKILILFEKFMNITISRISG